MNEVMIALRVNVDFTGTSVLLALEPWAPEPFAGGYGFLVLGVALQDPKYKVGAAKQGTTVTITNTMDRAGFGATGFQTGCHVGLAESAGEAKVHLPIASLMPAA